MGLNLWIEDMMSERMTSPKNMREDSLINRLMLDSPVKQGMSELMIKQKGAMDITKPWPNLGVGIRRKRKNKKIGIGRINSIIEEDTGL